MDTARGVVKAEQNVSTVGLYFFLFPHQIAGPIVRYDLFARQVYDRKTTLADFSIGVERFMQGLVKKVLIANSLAKGVDQIYALSLSDLSSPLAWLGGIGYCLQIYFDFSGYSDMAIGLARMFGFRFHENFNYPYSATSVTDFWRRWHMTLSNWFRDYLYIPLGGNRKSTARTALNLSIVFLLCGLWHGANWTFVVWGAWHGLFLIIERIGAGKLLTRSRVIGSLWTLVVVIIGFVYFRSTDVTYGTHFVARMFSFQKNLGDSAYQWNLLGSNHLFWAGTIAGLLFSSGHMMNAIKGFKLRSNIALYFYLSFLIVLFIISLCRLADETYNPFIYFKF